MGRAKKFNEAESIPEKGRKGRTDGLALKDNLQAAKTDDRSCYCWGKEEYGRESA